MRRGSLAIGVGLLKQSERRIRLILDGIGELSMDLLLLLVYLVELFLQLLRQGRPPVILLLGSVGERPNDVVGSVVDLLSMLDLFSL
jgi:hypothetical protein